MRENTVLEVKVTTTREMEVSDQMIMINSNQAKRDERKG